ncbi:alpha/beta hydrolase [Roseateles sp. LYH14W]|uniref:Alpha/beta hydrolase n=1 Tax=Pelomonas parva TaxID=3299032 RepID=A0ABW7EXG2_9BURK
MPSQRRTLLKATALSLALAAASGTSQAAPCTQDVCTLAPQLLWPAGVPAIPNWPGTAPAIGRDEVREGGEIVVNVSQPSYQAWLPRASKATGAAVLIAPGGGFSALSIRSEGTQVAQWLAERGIAAFVLRYRTFHQSPGETRESLNKRMFGSLASGLAGAAGVADGMEALRQIRAGAAGFGIDPQRIGAVGFSAGGHVVGMMALAANERERPNFVGLIYGMPMTTPLPPLPPAHLPYPEGTPKEPWLRPKPTPAPGALPPTFIAMAQDDLAVGTGVRAYYDAMFAAGYRPELHLYQRGNHGFGMRQQGSTSDRWLDAFGGWIAAEGFNKRPPAP